MEEGRGLRESLSSQKVTQMFRMALFGIRILWLTGFGKGGGIRCDIENADLWTTGVLCTHYCQTVCLHKHTTLQNGKHKYDITFFSL